jgi:hypothetical protein
MEIQCRISIMIGLGILPGDMMDADFQKVKFVQKTLRYKLSIDAVSPQQFLHRTKILISLSILYHFGDTS